MRRIFVVFLLILFLFASAGRVTAQSPTPLLATPTPRPSPISTPIPQHPLTPVTPTPQGDQDANWTDGGLRLLSLFITLILARCAWWRWRQDREANALDQLYQKYQDNEFADALKKVGKFEWDEDSSNNRYVLAEAFLFDPDHAKKRDEARRIVTTFWYRVAFLLDQGVISDEKTFVLLGSPEIVMKLEALEVVKADRLGRDFPVEWPPLALRERHRIWKRHRMKMKRRLAILKMRYRIRKMKRDFPTLPFSQEEFNDWKKESPPS